MPLSGRGGYSQEAALSPPRVAAGPALPQQACTGSLVKLLVGRKLASRGSEGPEQGHEGVQLGECHV